MNTKTEELLNRTFLFGVDTLKFLMILPKDKVYGIIIYQLGKASTSTGSNYVEAQGANLRKILTIKLVWFLKKYAKATIGIEY